MQLSLFDDIDIEIENPKKTETSIMHDDKNNYPDELSRRVLSEFNVEPQLVMCNFQQIYKKILPLLPPEKINFDILNIKTAVSCEFICAAICHKMNWDFLRQSVLIKTLSNPAWIMPTHLRLISSTEIGEMLAGYNKKERIRADERAAILRKIGQLAVENNCDFIDLIINKDKTLKDYSKVINTIKSCSIFSSDPVEKKLQLLIQKLANYKLFESLGNHCRPAIDYHLIRLFLRRGLITPKTEYARDYIMKLSSRRLEGTIAALRYLCSNIIENISKQTCLSINVINQIEWWVGRSICLSDFPDCHLEKNDSIWIKEKFDKCPFYEDCLAISGLDKYLILNEPNYTGTSY
jgi:hypothetical protein